MIWLIGNKGMLGTEIARQLTENKIDFVGTDREVDITDPQALASFATGKSISHIINCSAYTAVDKAETDTELAKKLNEDGPRNIANLANVLNATMIHISTDYVFDGSGNSSRTEDMPIAPIGVYGVTKAAGEKAVCQTARQYYILRTAWLYGWAGKNFVYTMLKAMNTHESVKVVADQKGTPTFAGDLANVIIKLIEKDCFANAHNDNGRVPYGIYHCTDLGETTWYDFTVEIKNQGIVTGWLNNPECTVNPCTTDEYPTPAKRPAYSVLSKDKIQKALVITLPQWQESLKKFLTSPLFDKTRLE